MMTTSPRAQCRDQNLLDPSEKEFAVDGTIDHAGRGEAIAAQRADKRRCLPMIMRHGIDQPLAAWRSSVAAGHVRLGPGLVDENEPARGQAWSASVASGRAVTSARIASYKLANLGSR